MAQRVVIFAGTPADPLPITVLDPLPVIVPGPMDVNVVGGDVVIDPVDLASLAQETTAAAIAANTANLDVALSTVATEATQFGIAADTANLDVLLSTRASEASFTARTPVLGQALMLASSPVVIASNQSSIPVSASQGGLWAVAQSGSWLVAAAQAGSWSVAQSGSWTVAISGTVPISAAALPLPSGAATEATLATRSSAATQLLIKAKTDNLDVLLSSISSAATQNLIKAKTDNLDVLLSTRATEATLATRLTEATFTTRTPVVGQALMAASSPVVIASNQSSIPTNKAASFIHLNAAGTTVIKASPGVLHKITINDFGGGVMTFYDNTAGSGAVIAAIKPAGNTGTLFYELSFTIGLTAVITGASPGDITVTYD